MKPGRVKGVELIGSPFYPSFHESACASIVVVSFNGATKAHSGLRVFHSGLLRAASYLNLLPNLPFPHSSLTPQSFKRRYRFPLVLTSAITPSSGVATFKPQPGAAQVAAH
jgi:hypothetical protein